MPDSKILRVHGTTLGPTNHLGEAWIPRSVSRKGGSRADETAGEGAVCAVSASNLPVQEVSGMELE